MPKDNSFELHYMVVWLFKYAMLLCCRFVPVQSTTMCHSTVELEGLGCEFNGHVGESQIDVFSVVPSFLPPFWPLPCLSLNYSRSLHRSPSILLLLLLLSASPALSR